MLYYCSKKYKLTIDKTDRFVLYLNVLLYLKEEQRNNMNNNGNSVLNKIMASHKLEELAQLNVLEIINYLIGNLNERERDVIRRRYGLVDGKKEILESIGKAHNLTRERVRQIEVSSIEKLSKMKDLDRIKRLKKIIIQILEEHGGLMEKDYLFDVLVHFSTRGEGRREGEEAHQNSFDFLLSKILGEEFEVAAGNGKFKPYYKLGYADIGHLHDLIHELEGKISEKSQVFATHEMIDFIRDLEVYLNQEEKFSSGKNIDLSGLFKNSLYQENYDKINQNKVLYSLLRSAKNIQQNVFGHWGLAHWSEIKPKNINDKIYLILKNHGNNLHFAEIAQRINEVGFDKKKANIASIHNELILDKKYVLVGRGIYGLKEWGLEKGTVSDVIEEVLKAAGESLAKEEIINRVLDKRIVKKTTIILALSNKDKFSRSGNRYSLTAAKSGEFSG